MFVIAGVTGNTGSVVANTLLDQGEKVRLLVRDEKKAEPFRARGAEVAIASIDDVVSLKRAVAGAKGVYALVPPDMATEDPIGRGKRIVDNWARAVGDIHTVFLSSVGAQHATGTGPIQYLHTAEKSFKNATFIRAAYFLENWGSVLGAARGDGVLPTFEKPDTRFSMVATKDIGLTAAQALLDAKPGVIELAGPHDLTPAEVAATVGKLLGRDVKPIHVSGDAIVNTLTGFGISKAVASLFREMAEAIDSGRVDWETKNVTRGTTSAETVLRTLLQRA
jgi:uncharacterized protein YbjT (DUF2867 family)